MNMKKILVGFIMDGKAGGIDRYLLNFFDSVKGNDVEIDFLTNSVAPELKKYIEAGNGNLIEVSSLMHPFKQYREIYDLVKKNRYDKAYFNISTGIAFPAVRAARKAGLKQVIVHSHNSGYDCLNPLKRKFMILLHNLAKGQICKYATDFYTCSDKAASWLFTRKVTESGAVVHIQNAIDTSEFSFSQEKRDEIRCRLGVEDKFVIGNVGNALYQKNHFFLIDVFAKAAEKDKDAVLILIGDGPLESAIKEKIESLGLRDRVMMLGRVNASDGYMSAFDVFALPSVFEGMPIVSVEAQCSSLPCVFSNTITDEAKISNMCEFVSIEANSVEKWADALLKYKNADRSKMKITKDLSCFEVKNQKEMFVNIVNS